MIRSPLLLLSACLVATQLAGCTAPESLRSSNSKSTHSAKSKSKAQQAADDDADETDEEYDDSWKYVGDKSRAGLAREEALDPWFGKYDYADKGRAIERNLR